MLWAGSVNSNATILLSAKQRTEGTNSHSKKTKNEDKMMINN